MLTMIIEIISFIADICVLIITIYSFYLTMSINRLKFCTMGNSTSMFFGESMSITLRNDSLRSIAITKVFWLKRIENNFHYLEVAKYEDDPFILDAWHIGKIVSKSYTKIFDLDDRDRLLYLQKDAVIGVESGNTTLWIKPYKKAPLRDAKKAYKNREYDILSVSSIQYNDKIISANVRYAINLLVQDINEKWEHKTIFVVVGSDGGIMSDTIFGYNGIPKEWCVSKETLKDGLCERFGINQDYINIAEFKIPDENAAESD